MPIAPVQLSLEEFLEREQRAEAKSEYYNGEVFAMAAGAWRTPVLARALRRFFGS